MSRAPRSDTVNPGQKSQPAVLVPQSHALVSRPTRNPRRVISRPAHPRTGNPALGAHCSSAPPWPCLSSAPCVQPVPARPALTQIHAAWLRNRCRGMLAGVAWTAVPHQNCGIATLLGQARVADAWASTFLHAPDHASWQRALAVACPGSDRSHPALHGAVPRAVGCPNGLMATFAAVVDGGDHGGFVRPQQRQGGASSPARIDGQHFTPSGSSSSGA